MERMREAATGGADDALCRRGCIRCARDAAGRTIASPLPCRLAARFVDDDARDALQQASGRRRRAWRRRAGRCRPACRRSRRPRRRRSAPADLIEQGVLRRAARPGHDHHLGHDAVRGPERVGLRDLAHQLEAARRRRPRSSTTARRRRCRSPRDPTGRACWPRSRPGRRAASAPAWSDRAGEPLEEIAPSPAVAPRRRQHRRAVGAAAPASTASPARSVARARRASATASSRVPADAGEEIDRADARRPRAAAGRGGRRSASSTGPAWPASGASLQPCAAARRHRGRGR